MNWDKTIFLAHAKEDKVFVRNFYNRLKENGLEPWLDEENLKPGVRWDDEIREAIRKSRFFIACLSKRSVTKTGYVQKELKMALSELEEKAPGINYFIPALIEDIELPNINVGTIRLRDYQGINIANLDGINRLISHLLTEVNVVQDVIKKQSPVFDQIRSFIAKSELETSLRELASYTSKYDIDMHNNVIMLTSRYNALKHENILGIISREHYTRENNKLTYSLLEIIKLLEQKQMN